MNSWCNDMAGSGGKAGNGGTIKVSKNCKIYAYNGDAITNGDYSSITVPDNITLSVTQKPNGQNTIPAYIYGQAGKSRAAYTLNNLEVTKFADLRKTLVAGTNTNIATTSYGQGIGSGAGYIELSNGSYSVDSNLN